MKLTIARDALLSICDCEHCRSAVAQLEYEAGKVAIAKYKRKQSAIAGARKRAAMEATDG